MNIVYLKNTTFIKFSISNWNLLKNIFTIEFPLLNTLKLFRPVDKKL